MVHADRLEVLREDATRERAADAQVAAELVREDWRVFEEFNVNPVLALDSLFVRLQQAFGAPVPS